MRKAHVGEKSMSPRGNIKGLTKHLVKKLGGDPHLFTKCMSASELSGYTEEQRAGICAKVHYIATGKWPGEHRSEKEDPMVTIIIDSEEVDDWMKSLPGYKDEVKLHEEIEEKLKDDK